VNLRYNVGSRLRRYDCFDNAGCKESERQMDKYCRTNMMFLVSLFVLLHSLGKSTVYCLLRASTSGDEKIGESDEGSKSSNVRDAGGEGNVCDVYEIIAELQCLACSACELCKNKANCWTWDDNAVCQCLFRQHNSLAEGHRDYWRS
jgi:hypothetical protein